MGSLNSLTICLLFLTCVNADLFTSMADLQRLLQIEKDIPKVIDNYIVTENARLDELKKYVSSIEFVFNCIPF